MKKIMGVLILLLIVVFAIPVFAATIGINPVRVTITPTERLADYDATISITGDPKHYKAVLKRVIGHKKNGDEILADVDRHEIHVEPSDFQAPEELSVHTAIPEFSRGKYDNSIEHYYRLIISEAEPTTDPGIQARLTFYIPISVLPRVTPSYSIRKLRGDVILKNTGRLVIVIDRPYNSSIKLLPGEKMSFGGVSIADIRTSARVDEKGVPTLRVPSTHVKNLFGTFVLNGEPSGHKSFNLVSMSPSYGAASEIMTDKDGHFYLDAIPSNTETINVTMDGHTKEIHIPNGRSKKGVDLGIIEMAD